MFEKIILLLLLASQCRGMQVKEPQWPTQICFTLDAFITETPVGHIPESMESRPDTQRIQIALNHCGAGKAVKLVKSSGNAFVSGPLTLPTGVTLWIDSGVTLFASRNPRDYDVSKDSCGVINGNGLQCLPLISVKNTKNSGIVGDGIIDGRGGQKIIGSGDTWWQMADKAQKENKKQNCPRLVIIEDSQDFTLYHITFHNSPNFHVSTKNLNGFTVWGVTVDTPSKAYPSGTHARNTDAFDPNGQNILFSNCYINTGDDHIALGGNLPISNVLVQDCHFYRGHGMSIGSETDAGVRNVTVKNLSIDGADNGLRIKSDSSRGGDVSGITYENICIRNTNAPLVFDSFYSSKTGQKYPNFHDITVKNARIVSSKGKKLTLRGYNAQYPLKLTLNNVHSDVLLNKVVASNAIITENSVSNLKIQTNSKENVHVTSQGASANPIDCSHMFVSLPRK